MTTTLPYRPLKPAVNVAGSDASAGASTQGGAQMPILLAPPNETPRPAAAPTPAASQPITGTEQPRQIQPPARNAFALPGAGGSYSASTPAAPRPQQQTLEQIMASIQSGGGGWVPQVSSAAPGTSAMMGDLLAQIRSQLANPSPWDDEAFKATEAQIKESIDGQYTRDKQALEAQLAERGLGWGSTAASELGTLAKGKVENFNAAMVPLLRERAQMISANRNAATQAGLSLASLEQSAAAEAARAQNSASQTNAQMAFQAALAEMERQGRAVDRYEDTRRYDLDFGESTRRFDLGFGEDVRRTNEDFAFRDRQEQRGERSYLDNLRTTARDQAIQEAMLAEQVRMGRDDQLFRYLMGGMGQDDGMMDALRLAYGAYGDQAGQYGQQAAQAANWLGDAATSASYYFGGRR